MVAATLEISLYGLKALFHYYMLVKNWAGLCGDQIPVGARFSAPVQTNPEAHPGSYAMGTGSFLGAK